MISGHVLCVSSVRRSAASDPATLAGSAAVVGLRRHVPHAGHLEARGLERADRGLTAGAGPLDEHLDLLQAVLDALAGGRVGGHLGGERRRFARALEARAARRLPGDDVAVAVGERHDRVVEGRLDVRLPDRDVLAHAATAALGPPRSGHVSPPRVVQTRARSWSFGLRRSFLSCLLLAGDLHALRSLARARVRLRVLTAHRQTAAMAQTAVGADLLQALDRLRALAAQVTLDDERAVDQVAELDDLLLGEVAHLAIGLDPDLREQLVRGRAADAVDVGEADLDPLVEGDVDPGDSRHRSPCGG